MVLTVTLLKDARPLYDVTTVVKIVTLLVLQWLCAIFHGDKWDGLKFTHICVQLLQLH